MVISYSIQGIAVDLFLSFTEFTIQIFDPLIEILHKGDMLFFGPIPQELHPNLALLEPLEVLADFLESDFGFVDRLGNFSDFSSGDLFWEFLNCFLASFLFHHYLL
jgi:hypothetical protein